MDFKEAVVIYDKHAESAGTRTEQPNEGLSDLINGVWYLRNVNGLLARVGTNNKQVF